jgi:hypothetical protein
MRRRALYLVAAAPALVALACGHNTPPPQDGSDVVGFKGPNTTDTDKASITVPEGGAATAPTTASTSPGSTPASTAAPMSTTPPTSEADDIANVHHQIAAPEVSKTVAKVKPKIQACYHAGLKRDGSCSGEVKVKFVVKHDGTMVDAQDQGSSMNDEEVTKCIVEVIKTLKFPVQESPGPAFGIYAINLSP